MPKKQQVGRPKGNRQRRLHLCISKDSEKILTEAEKKLNLTKTQAIEEALQMLSLRLKNYK